MKINRAIIFTLFYVLLVSNYSFALEVTTGTQESSGITDEAGIYLYGGSGGGDLVQIIHANSSIHVPDKFGDPTGGDAIIGTAEIGLNFPFDPNEGKFSADITATTGWKIYCRAWNSTEATSSTYYGDSELYTVVGGVDEKWDINGPGNIPAFKTSHIFDNAPPGPPSNINATQEVSGDIIITWTITTEPDATGTRLVFRTNRYPTKESDGTILTNIPTTSAQSYRHANLTDGQRYWYSAFSYDASLNYSGPISTSQESNDTLPPYVVGNFPTGTGVPVTADMVIIFDDTMDQTAVQNAFSMFPAKAGNFSWISKTMYFNPSTDLDQAQTYTCTVNATASDDAGNQMGISNTWSFFTVAGLPPLLTDLKIDGWKKYPGDIISPQPRVSGYINDPELGGIVSIEFLANATSHMISSPEINSILNSISGYFDYRYPKLSSGTYALTVRAWDASGNLTEEVVAGLLVKGGGGGDIVGNVLNYPSIIESGKGTNFAFTLTNDMDVQIYVYSIKGSIIYHKKIDAGNPGGIAGYNEVYWDGMSDFGEGIGNGMYIVKFVSGGSVLKSFKILIVNN